MGRSLHDKFQRKINAIDLRFVFKKISEAQAQVMASHAICIFSLKFIT